MAAKRRNKRPDEIRREQAANRDMGTAEQSQPMERGVPGRPGGNPRDPQDRHGGKNKR